MRLLNRCRFMWTGLATVCVFIGSAVSQGTPVRLDSSDWWSYTRQEELPEQEPFQKPNFQHREPPEATFQIAGVTLGETWDFNEIRSRFGDSTEVQRGDAASGRNQLCYKSADNVHLIFEFGEVDGVLYLFKDGPKWKGSELCATSRIVSPTIATASGLRLGMGTSEVENILGEPSLATPQRLVYYFDYKRKTSAKALAEFRDSNPKMSGAEFSK